MAGGAKASSLVALTAGCGIVSSCGVGVKW